MSSSTSDKRSRSSGFKQRTGYSMKRPDLDKHAEIKRRAEVSNTRRRSTTPGATGKASWTGTPPSGLSKRRLSDAQKSDQRQKWLDTLQRKADRESKSVNEPAQAPAQETGGTKPGGYQTTGVQPPQPMVGPSPRLFRPNSSRQAARSNDVKKAPNDERSTPSIQNPIVTTETLDGFNVGKAEMSRKTTPRNANANTTTPASASGVKGSAKVSTTTSTKSRATKNVETTKSIPKPEVKQTKLTVSKPELPQVSIQLATSDSAERGTNVVRDVLDMKRHVGVLVVRPSKDRNTLTCLLCRSVEWTGLRIPKMDSTTSVHARQVAFRAATRYGGISSPNDSLTISRNVPPFVYYLRNDEKGGAVEVVEVLVAFIDIDDDIVDSVWSDPSDVHGTGGFVPLDTAAGLVASDEEKAALLRVQASLALALEHGAIAA